MHQKYKQVLLEMLELSSMLVCFLEEGFVSFYLKLGGLMLLLQCSAEASVQSDRSTGARRRLHPLKTRSEEQSPQSLGFECSLSQVQ